MNAANKLRNQKRMNQKKSESVYNIIFQGGVNETTIQQAIAVAKERVFAEIDKIWERERVELQMRRVWYYVSKFINIGSSIKDKVT